MAFIEQLQCEINLRRKLPETATEWTDLVDLPIAAELGTIFLYSELGTVIRCDSVYSSKHPMRHPASQKIIDITFTHLIRLDRMFLNRWDDFVFFDTEQFHAWIWRLRSRNFRIFTL